MRWLSQLCEVLPFGDGQFMFWSFQQLLLFFFFLIEFSIIFLSVDIFPIIRQYFYSMFIKLRLHKQSLIIYLRPNRVIQFAIIPTQLYLIQYLLNKFIFAIIVLPPDQVQIRRFFNNEFVILQAEGQMGKALPLWGTGFLKAADSSIIRRAWIILTTFLLSSRSMGVSPLAENIVFIYINLYAQKYPKSLYLCAHTHSTTSLINSQSINHNVEKAELKQQKN